MIMDSNRRRTWVRDWKFWLGLGISIAFLVIALQGLNLHEFWHTLHTANYWWLIPGVAVYFIALIGRSWRWHYLLKPIRALPTRDLFPLVTIGYMGNNIYPARAGEVLRSYVLWRKYQVPISSSLTTVVLERLFDGLVMLLFVFVTLPFAPLPAGYDRVVILFSMLFGIALVIFFLIASRPERIAAVYALMVDRFVPPRFRERVHGLFDSAIVGLQSLRSPRDMMLIFLSSTLIWLGETTKYWFVMHAFDFEVSFPVLMLMTAVVNLFTTIPAAPGHIGTFDLPGIAILQRAGVEHAIATGYTLVLHVALWLPVTLLGVFYMLRESIQWRDVEQLSATSATVETP